MNNDNLNNEREEIINENTIEPEIINETLNKNCVFCGREIKKEFNFCTYCGKLQKASSQENINKPVKKPTSVKGKVKSKKTKIFLNVVFILSFVFSGLTFIIGLIRLVFYNSPSIGIFGTDTATLIINSTIVLSSLLMSIFFLILGIFFNRISHK